jgi:Tfp pilus assembly protein PilZ
MSDQRKDSRKKLMAFTPVYDFISHALLGYVGNINLSGVMVVGEHAVEVGKDLTLHIELPESLLDKPNQNLLMPARVAWCKEETAAKSFTVGCEFTNVTAEQQETIEAILERYHFKYE